MNKEALDKELADTGVEITDLLRGQLVECRNQGYYLSVAIGIDGISWTIDKDKINVGAGGIGFYETTIESIKAFASATTPRQIKKLIKDIT